MFKKGDRVKILKKSIGYKLHNTPFKVGEIGIYQHLLVNKTGHCIYQQKKQIQWNFADGDFELVQESVPKFKVGDTVEILSKSCNKSILYAQNKIGDVITIDRMKESSIVKGGYKYSPNNGYDSYLEKDLKAIEEVKMYKFKKDLYVIDILNSSSPSKDEKRKFYNWVLEKNLDMTKPIEMTNDFIKKFESSACFKDWLFMCGYIEKLKEFEPFTISIEITSDRMYWTLWHRLFVMGEDFEKYTERETNETLICDIENSDTNSLFDIIDKYKDKVDKNKK